ncbi:MAG: tetratricopeptide repeat protein [Anaerolineales bacterium]
MTGRQDLFDESMRLGHSAAWELEWDRAIEFYRKALAEFPDDASALSSLGLALLETDQLKESLAVYHHSAKGNPLDPVPVEKCAEIFERLGQISEALDYRDKAAELHIKRRDVEKAIQNWTQLARLAPDNLPARSRLAVTHERLGRRRDAVLEYVAVASLLQRAGKIERATEAAQRALSLIPGDPDASNALRSLRQGKAMAVPGQPRGSTGPLSSARAQEFLATDQYERADEAAADPEVTAQRHALAILAAYLFEDVGDEAAPAEKGRGVRNIAKGRLAGEGDARARPRIVRYLTQAIDLQTRGHIPQAIKELARAVEAGLDIPAAHYDLGLLHKQSEEYDEARKHLSMALGHPELALGANLALGRLAKMQEEWGEAARYLMQALRLADSLSVDESQSTQLGQLYDGILATQGQGDPEGLRRTVDSTLEFLTGPEWLSRLRAARHQLETQTPGTAVVPIAEMLALGGSDRVLRGLGRIDELITAGFLTSAMEEAMLALTAAPTYMALHQRMADILIRGGRQDAGLTKLARIAETHRVRGEVQQAIESYRAILQYAPIDMNARSHLVELLTQQGRVSEALQQHLELADLYRQLAQIDKARESLAEAQTLAEQSSVERALQMKIAQQMADIDLSRLDWRRALKGFQQILQLDPADDKSRVQVIDLAFRLGQEDLAAAELDRHLEQLVQSARGADALAFLEEMAREHPGKQALHARLAEAYRAAGRKADAIAQYDALGEIQLDSGNATDAIRTIQTILGLEPPDKQGYMELLRNLEANR